MDKYKVADYTEETYCEECGRLLTVGDTVYPLNDHVFCSTYCKEQATKAQEVNRRGEEVCPHGTAKWIYCQPCAIANPIIPMGTNPICGYKAYGMMPACVLEPGHLTDHQDGFGGHYGRTDDLELVRVEDSKELRYQPLKPQRNMLDELEQPPLF